MLPSVRAVPHIEIERESDPARVCLFTVNSSEHCRAHAPRSTIMNTEPLFMSKPTARLGRIAILWRGDDAARSSATPETSRFKAVFAALADVGVDTQPVVYEDDVIDAVRAQIATLDGVLVWVNPIHNGRNRANLDALLREVAAKGVWVSAHPDVILKMGTKEVLFRTRQLGWGTDTYLYRSLQELKEQFPSQLASGVRVLKQNRGNGGIGTWKVELSADASSSDGLNTIVRVLHARRGSVEENLTLRDFIIRCDPYFTGTGCMIDQPFQPRLSDGMIRCYMVGDQVAGFGHQLVKALMPSPVGIEPVQPGPRIMSDASEPAFQILRRKMESEW